MVVYLGLLITCSTEECWCEIQFYGWALLGGVLNTNIQGLKKEKEAALFFW